MRRPFGTGHRRARHGALASLRVAGALLLLAVTSLWPVNHGPGYGLGLRPAHAQSPSDDPVRGLRSSELRLVQAAMALQEAYDGLIDGAFGPRSRSALEGYRDGLGQPDRSDDAMLGTLIRDYETELATHGWESQRSPSRVFSYLAPNAPPDGFSTVASIDGNQTMRGKHDALEGEHAGPGAPYTVRRNDFFVTSVERADGGRIYLRSDRQGSSGFDSLRIDSDQASRGRLQLVASSVSDRRSADLALPETGRLVELAALATPKTRAIGSGAYVTPTEIVTSTAVVDGCAAPALADGTPLEVVTVEASVGLAVLKAPTPWTATIRVAPPGRQRLGGVVLIAGHREEEDAPAGSVIGGAVIAGISGGSLSIGGAALLSAGAPPSGFVSLAGLDPGHAPGDAVIGGPDMLFGVLAPTMDDGTVLATGTTALRRTLANAGVEVQLGDATAMDLPDLSDETAGAIVRLACSDA